MSASSSPTADTSQLKRKRRKVRSTWISFIGRIVAQVVGAIASVTLGLVVLTRYGFPDRTTSTAAAPVAAVHHTGDHQERRAAGDVALAVLPIQNYSSEASHAIFADGVTEALTSEIAQRAGLRVTSRTSAMAYKGTSKTLPEIARELDVDLILEGSIVRDQALVRITAQLIDAATDRHIWARSYDRPVRQVLPVQAEMAQSIAKDVYAAIARRTASPLP